MVDSRGTRGVVRPFGGGHVEVVLVIFCSGRVFTKSTIFWDKIDTSVTIFEAYHVHVLAHSVMTYAMSSFAV
jgi:hypothetical protein